MIEMFIPVKPIAKGRPRFGKGRVYTPESTKKAEQDIGLIVKSYMQINMIAMTSLPVFLEASFMFNKDVMNCGDLDNLLKTLCDSLNKIVWDDDKQVYMINAKKEFNAKYGIYLKVGEL